MSEEQTRSERQKVVSDEEILNVYRKSEKPFLKTGDIVKEIPIQERAVQKRLKKLEKKGRLESEPVGQAVVRWLADDEPENIVYKEEAKYFRWSKKIDSKSDSFQKLGIGFFAVAGFLMLAAIGVELTPTDLFPLSSRSIFVGVAVVVYFAAITAILWGGSKCVGYLLRQIGERERSS